MKVSSRPQKIRAASSGHGAKRAKAGDSSLHEAGSANGVHVRVAELAYYLYEQRGREDGHDVEDWIQAEQSILGGQS